MVDSNAVVHAVRLISVAEDAHQIDPGLTITGNPGNAESVDGSSA